ncbi:MAG: hypothetical protein ACREBU_20590, partial [Nitrososphaera sp.]
MNQNHIRDITGLQLHHPEWPRLKTTLHSKVVQPVSAKKIGYIVCILLCGLVVPNALAQQGFWIMARDLALDGKDGWEYYDSSDSPEGAYMGWIRSGDFLNGRIALGRDLSPTRYHVFLKVIDYTGGGKIEVSLGGLRASINTDNDDWNRYWTLPVAIPVVASTNSIQVTLIRTDLSDP